MATRQEIAAAGATIEERRAARVAEIAASLRAEAQATHASLVEQETTGLAAYQQLTDELDRSAQSAAATVEQAQATVDAAVRALNGARADEAAIVARRRGATMAHIDVMRALTYRIAALQGKLTDEYWMAEAEARVANMIVEDRL
jgi:hypothetical protein